MDAASPLDPEVLRRMRDVVTSAIGTRNRSLAEAAAEARGLGRGMRPALPVTVIDAAVVDLLREAGAQMPEEPTVEHDGQALRPVTPEEVADSLAFAMRFNGRGKARRTGHEYTAQLAADQLVQQMLASGYVILRRPVSPYRTGSG
ncbi:hypothetical protein [Falsiroseomonas tokyonensis]|uniref:Uncharacterized protein n=1 Tax=Falsiroseomonas tokyonensis TaxID=430521 RepID=A0ABV7C1A1_9PROT|nr:hypothetical protein [Falsiroseomonas tokyonensis]MBU8541250.1 hypothetical protein [Falsiroseomonas tokyonensis]